MRLYRSTANFTKVEKIAIQWIALSGLCTTGSSSYEPRLAGVLTSSLLFYMKNHFEITWEMSQLG